MSTPRADTQETNHKFLFFDPNNSCSFTDETHFPAQHAPHPTFYFHMAEVLGLMQVRRWGVVLV